MKFCNYQLPRSSRLGRLWCIRKSGHKGRHWVYILRPGNRLEVYEVHAAERGLKTVLTAVTYGPITREAAAELTQYIELERFYRGD